MHSLLRRCAACGPVPKQLQLVECLLMCPGATMCLSCALLLHLECLTTTTAVLLLLLLLLSLGAHQGWQQAV